jgi:signal transduction histidine kinase/ligand-binding sensor domain-containing protein
VKESQLAGETARASTLSRLIARAGQASGQRRRLVGVFLSALLVMALTDRAFGLDPSLSLAQFIHTSWNGTAGFALPGVWALAQTSDGYLWLGTEHGLIRFDGVRFVRWQSPDGEAFPDSAVTSLTSSASGGLWIGMRGAILRLRDGRLERYTTANGLPGGQIVTMVEDRGGRLWAGCPGPNGEGLILIQNGSVTTFGQNHGLPNSRVLSLFLDHNNSLWVGIYGGFCRWTGKTAELCRTVPAGFDVKSMAQSADGSTFLAGTTQGLLQFAGGDAEPVIAPLGKRSTFVRALLLDRDSTLWAGTIGQGLFRIRNGKVEQFTRLDGLSSDVIQSLFEDREGNLWAGTPNGVDRFREPKVARWSARQGLSGNVVTAVCAAHEGGLWAGVMGGGLNRIGGDLAASPSTMPGMEGASVLALHEDSKGTLWAGTSRRFGYFAQGKFQEIRSGNGEALSRVFAITEGPDGTLWLADSAQGLQRLRKGRLEPFTAGGIGAGKAIYKLMADHTGNLWVGYFDRGLAVLRGASVQAYDVQAGLAAGPVQALYEDTSGAVWVGTREGLSRFRKSQWTTWTSRQGLPPGGVQAIIQDTYRHLWLVTSSGLLRAEMPDLDRQPDGVGQQLSLAIYGPNDGIRLAEGVPTANPRIAISGDGRLWFSTDDGLAGMNPAPVRSNGLPPPVLVEQMTVDGKPLRIAPAEIALRSHSVEFEYTALSLTLPEAIRFRYQLEGFDKDWIDAGARRQIAYASLPPRHFRFHVIACNNDGVWNTAGAAVAFRCEPFFYQTWWFVAVCCGVLGLCAWLVHRYRLGLLRSRFQLVLDERARLTRELHDTLLQGFTGVVFQLEAASRQLLSSPGDGRRRIDLALEQADQSLKEARQALSCLRLPALENTPLPDALAEAARQIVDGTSIRFHMELKGTVRELPYEVQANLFIIAREAMNNAMSHAKPGRISLELDYSPDGTRLAVQDDGIGFDPQVPQQAGHLGVTGMRERARKIAGSLTVESGAGRGTTVEIVVPSKRHRGAG